MEARLQPSGAPLYSNDGMDFERCVAQLQATLTPADLSAAWAVGRALSLDAAVAAALSESP